MRSLAYGIAAALAVGGLLSGAALADPNLFNGKTIKYVVATDVGGGYDTNGRLVAEFMQKHLPGSTIVVQNMPGAGHLVGTNFINASAPDGLTIGTFNTGLIYSQLAGLKGVKFDLAKMGWIGKVSSDPRVFVVSKQSDIENFDQLKSAKQTVKFAAAGVGSASTIESTMLVKALGLPVQVITGYNGNDDQLAMRRGEVQGIVGSRSTFEQFVKDGHGKFIAQIGGTQTDVPQLSTLVSGDAAQKAIALVASQSNISRLTAGPPGMSAETLGALREAYQAAVSDPEFVKKAAGLNLPVEPLVGDKVGQAVAVAMEQTPETVEFLKQALKKD